jgi:hypothetical protein
MGPWELQRLISVRLSIVWIDITIRVGQGHAYIYIRHFKQRTGQTYGHIPKYGVRIRLWLTLFIRF